ncbi:MAG: hypothetical protein AAF152_07085 [Cyanobacteria bacterium P01_A01_bin.114]
MILSVAIGSGRAATLSASTPVLSFMKRSLELHQQSLSLNREACDRIQEAALGN